MSVKPKLALIPSGVKASKLYSVLPSDASGDFDFSRSGSATRINKDGLIETVDSNVPRLNYPLIDGVVQGCPSLLLENSSTNLVTYSEDFSQSSWVKSNASITENSAISPNGTQNAETFTITSNFGYFYKAPSLASGTTVTQSIFVKNIDADRINLQVRTASTAGLASFFFTNSEITSVELTNGISADFDNYGNGWYRIYLTCTTTETNQLFRFQLSESGMSCYIWGAMVEEQSYVTSYIPSLTGSQTTRSAETCNNSGDANTFNDSEGVLMAEISALANDGTNRFLGISDGSLSNRVNIVYNASNELIAQIQGAGSLTADSVNILLFNKSALKYKSGDNQFWVNGFKVDFNTSTSGATVGLDVLDLEAGNGSFDFYGNTKQIQYFDTALTDTDLEQLTSWTSFNEMAKAQLYKTY